MSEPDEGAERLPPLARALAADAAASILRAMEAAAVAIAAADARVVNPSPTDARKPGQPPGGRASRNVDDKDTCRAEYAPRPLTPSASVAPSRPVSRSPSWASASATSDPASTAVP